LFKIKIFLEALLLITFIISIHIHHSIVFSLNKMDHLISFISAFLVALIVIKSQLSNKISSQEYISKILI